MVDSSTNINKTNIHLSPQTIEHEKVHDIWRWKSRSWREIHTYCWLNGRYTPIVGWTGDTHLLLVEREIHTYCWLNGRYTPSVGWTGDTHLLLVEREIHTYCWLNGRYTPIVGWTGDTHLLLVETGYWHPNSHLLFLVSYPQRLIWLSNLLTLTVPDEGYFRRVSCTLN
jgi:hypothetical protein